MQLSIEEAADYTGIGRNTLRQLVEWKKLPVLKVGRKVLIKTDILEMFMEANEGRDLRDRGNVKAVTKNCGKLKRRLPKKPPKVLSDQSHDIPTRKKIIPCASSDTQPRTYVCKRKGNVIMAKSTKSYEERMLEMEKREQESLEKAKRYAAQRKELLKRKKTEESKKRTIGSVRLAVRWNPFLVLLLRKKTSQS